MSQRRGQLMPPTAFEAPQNERSRCLTALCVSWKVLTCIFSHVALVTLVVSYCILGAVTFEHLESDNEKIVKKGIAVIRGNLTEAIWLTTLKDGYLHQENWTLTVIQKLQDFETEVLQFMKTKGWDGNEDENQLQWTFAGALFYSIIVITTIGYGHIAPKTLMGKVTTIFYAILGIPLMLLCLSNIGDIMASSFRFLYWRVCCFVCTREPKKSKRLRPGRGTIRQSGGGGGRQSGRSYGSSFRKPERTSTRSHDSGIEPYYESGMSHAYSDTELRYNSLLEKQPSYYQDRDRDRGERSSGHSRNTRFHRERERERYRDRHTVERERNVGKNNKYENDLEGLPQSRRYNTTGRINRDSGHNKQNRHTNELSISVPRYVPAPTRAGIRAHSLDRRARKETPDPEFDQEPPYKTPVLLNKYAIDELERDDNNQQRYQRRPRGRANPRSQSAPRPMYGNRLELPPSPPLPRDEYQDDEIDEHEIELQRIRKPKRRDRSAPPPSPRIMSPMGFAVNRQSRYDENSLNEEDWDSSFGDMPARQRPVPIWLCVFLVISYILAGAFLFSKWEHWSFLDSAYFCFITLTTIGFGDFVPAQGVKSGSEVSIALCSLYLLFGIALLAMSFNLVQEEVIGNVKSVARRLGILKEEEVEE